jgi:predicted RND superfamily exporter protein
MTRLTEYSIHHPKLVIALSVFVTLAFAALIPMVKTDTDPKNMLPATSDVRVFNDQVEKTFALHKDVIVLGIVNPKTIFNPASLERIEQITRAVMQLKGVALEDVMSFTTADNVVAEENNLTVRPLLTAIPRTAEELESFKRELLDNPLWLGRLISADGKTTAIYIPLEPGANAKEVADRLREIVRKERGDEQYYIAGDPVARDTFGAEMFKQMAIFSPLAGMIMMVALFFMFRSLPLVSSIMAVAFMSIIWTMGLLIGFGFPVHIMSSMIPVFLMAISTDSIHIFNEFFFRFNEVKDKKRAVIDTMESVGAPVKYTALATAVGFAVLAIGGIIPVRVFGLFVAFGTMVIRLMSFTFLPAIMSLQNEGKLLKSASRDSMEIGTSLWLGKLAKFAIHRPRTLLGVGIVLLALVAVGMTQIRVNNNMVKWFRPQSEVRKADFVMNANLAGTSVGYIVAQTNAPEGILEPQNLKYLEALQKDLSQLPVVGKTTSLADLVKRMHQVMNQNDSQFYRIPSDKKVIAQYLFMLGMAAKPSTLNNLVDYPYEQANLMVQLTTWDARAMQEVIDRIHHYQVAHPSAALTFKPAGTAYFNLIWNNEVLYDMIKIFGVALILVFLILSFNFRSFKWGLVSYFPLIFTVLLIYGFLGFAGKDFDMPVSVLSTLSLGMAVDFAIHFIKRFKQRYSEDKNLEQALVWVVERPGRGILRNALLFSLAFSVMIFASLTPYITVGVFIAALMMISAVLTLIYLPALIVIFRKYLINDPEIPVR